MRCHSRTGLNSDACRILPLFTDGDAYCSLLRAVVLLATARPLLQLSDACCKLLQTAAACNLLLLAAPRFCGCM